MVEDTSEGFALSIPATDGYVLGATCFSPNAVGPYVILNSATAVKQTYYAKFARWLATHDMTVLTYDYRGIGTSRQGHVRQLSASMRDWGEKDFEGVLQFAVSKKGHRPLFLLGHSVGGQLLGLAPSNHHLKRIVTVASQSGHWRHWPGMQKWAMATLWHAVIPTACRLFGHVPSFLGMGEDLPSGVARQWAQWGRHPDYLLSDGISQEGFARIRADILSVSLTDDFYAPEPAVRWLHNLFSNSNVTHYAMDPKDIGAQRIGHFGFFRSQFEKTVWTKAAEFLSLGANAPQAESAIPE